MRHTLLRESIVQALAVAPGAIKASKGAAPAALAAFGLFAAPAVAQDEAASSQQLETITVTGEGYESVTPTISPSSITFDPVQCGTPAGTQSVTVSNPGSIPMQRGGFTISPQTAIIPGTMIFLAVLSINFVGDGLRDALDPRRTL